jgi:hypothetical protein
VYCGKVTIPGERLKHVCTAAHALAVYGLVDFLPVTFCFYFGLSLYLCVPSFYLSVSVCFSLFFLLSYNSACGCNVNNFNIMNALMLLLEMQASSKYSNLNSDYISLSSDDDRDEETSDGERFVRVFLYNFLLSFNPDYRVIHITKEIG